MTTTGSASKTVSPLAYCLLAALTLFSAAPVQAQSAHVVSWNCLMSATNAATSPIFTAVPPAGCVVPSVPWSTDRAAAIVPPGVPGGLTATVNGQTIALTWNAPNGQAPASYVVQAGSSSGAANVVDASTESDLPSLTATNVPDGVYFFRVLSHNASGTSAASNEVAVRVGSNAIRTSAVGKAAACIVPPAPTSLTKVQNGNISVLFVWAAGEGACQAFALPDYYIIEYGFAPGQTAGGLRVPNQPTNSTVSLIGVGAGTYYVRVRAYNANGASLPSNEIALNVGGVCTSAPVTPARLAATAAGSTVVFTWDELSPAQNSPTGYRLAVGVQPGTTVVQIGVSTNIYRATSVPAGTYYVRVSGVNACGVSADSNEFAVSVGGSATPATVTGVHQFAGAPGDGSNRSTVMVGSDGNFYGTSVTGGVINSRCVSNLEGCGVIWRMTTGGTFTVLYNFGGSSPIYPYGRLLQASDGNFYGVTTGQEAGGGAASIFVMTPAGAVKFISELGGPSYSSLIQGADGLIYGTTTTNGTGTCSWRSTQCTPSSGSGTIFKMTLAGAITYIKTFSGGDGSLPYGGLVKAGDGTLWGTTSAGGTKNAGTIYRISPDGTFATVYNFTGGADGANPAYSNLIIASDGLIWGTTQFGGDPVNAGVIFKMTTAGALTVVHAFTGTVTKAGDAPPTTAIDGLQPGAGLLEGPDGNLYGVAGGGGGLGGGTAFMVTKAGAYTQLYAFGGSSEGGSPTATFVLGPDGNLWSTAQYGGSSNRGVVFKMTLPK